MKIVSSLKYKFANKKKQQQQQKNQTNKHL